MGDFCRGYLGYVGFRVQGTGFRGLCFRNDRNKDNLLCMLSLSLSHSLSVIYIYMCIYLYIYIYIYHTCVDTTVGALTDII